MVSVLDGGSARAAGRARALTVVRLLDDDGRSPGWGEWITGSGEAAALLLDPRRGGIGGGAGLPPPGLPPVLRKAAAAAATRP